MSCISGSMSKPGRYHYFLMYKPYGVLCQFTPEIPGQTTLAEVYAFPKGVYPAGRLDQDSEGMLLLTDDPGLKTMLLDPANSMTKSYAVQVEGCPAEADLAPLTEGMTIRIKGKPVSLRPAFFRIPNHPLELPERVPPVRFRKQIPDTWVEIVLTEGKNRQVRRMMAALGFPVLRLVRTALGNWRMTDLLPGQVVSFTREEVLERLGLGPNGRLRD